MWFASYALFGESLRCPQVADQKRFIHRRSTQHVMQPGRKQTHSSDSTLWRRKLLVPDRLLWYRTDCIVTQGLSVVMYRPGQLPSRGSVISGELQAGGRIYVNFLLDCSYDPTEGHREHSASVHFCDSYPKDIFLFTFKFLCLLLLQVFISMVLTLPSLFSRRPKSRQKQYEK